MRYLSTAKQVGALLQAQRKALGLSQTQVAEKLGLSQNRLSELESQPETMTVQQLIALATVLGLELHVSERSKDRPQAEW